MIGTRLAAITIAVFCLCVCPPCRAAAAAGASDREAAASEFINKLAAGDFAGAEDAFDANMKRALSVDGLAQVWRRIEANAGRYEKQEAVRTGKLSGMDVVFVTCRFERGLLDAKVVFNGAGEVAGLWFVPSQEVISQSSESIPEYLASDGITETAVSVGSGSISLPGTLRRPKGNGPFPAVVLVHGSGPNDRDETIYQNKPFRDLAQGLAANGIAVLRYDKRTLVLGARMRATAATVTVKEETIDDALAAVDLLRADKDIDPDRVFILGHSLGGYLAPWIGKLDSRLAGLILLAGTSRPLEDVIAEQMRYIFSLDGETTPAEKTQLTELDAQVARVKDANLLTAQYSPRDLPLGLPQAYWADLKDYDPIRTAAGLDRPILVLWGERDYQVTRADYERWRKGLSAGHGVTFKSYPGLNHLFLDGQGRSTPAEYERAGHIPEEVIRDISAWIKSQTGQRQRDSVPEVKP